MTQTPLVGSTFFGMDLSVLVDRFWMFRRRVSKRVLLLEFGSASLTVAQARYSVDEVEFTHVRRVELPPGATERGVPTEPAKMASLIQQICKEEKIYAHRTAVVLPAKAAFNAIIKLPQGLTLDEARAYARNPSSGLQIPIPLQQTDFDLVPCSGHPIGSHPQAQQPYFLTSVPQKLVDQLLETLQKADLEVLSVDLAFCCQLRLMAADVASLKPGQFFLMIEFVRECSHLVVIASSGPVALFRLPAIREFPAPVFDPLKTEAAIQEALSAEAIVLADDDYMPISDLDLRVLVQEVQHATQQFSAKIPAASWKGVAITGINSAHPGLAQLLEDALDLEVHVMRPLGATGVGAVTFSSLLVHQSLGRLLGLGLGFLPHDSLVACSLSPLADHHEFLALQDDVLPLVPSADELVDRAEVLIDPLANQASDAPSESPPPLPVQESPSFVDQPLVQETLDQPSINVDEKEAVSEEEVVEASEEEDEEWPSLGLGLSVGEEAKSEAVIVGLAEESASGEEEGSGIGTLTFAEEEEWSSINVDEKEAVSEEEVVEASEEEEDEEWPSLGLGLSVGEEAKSEAVIVGLAEESASGEEEGSGIGTLTFAEEEEWPSINVDEKEAVSEEEVVEASEEEDEECPSLGLGLSVGEEAKSEAVIVGLAEESASGEEEGSGIGTLTFAEEEEWSSINVDEKEAVSEEEVVEASEEEEDEEWPSLGLGLSVGEEAKSEAVIVGLAEESASGEEEGSGIGTLTFAEEEEWPSINVDEKEASSDLLRQDQSVPHLEMDSQSLLKAHSPQEVEQTVPSSPINPMNQSQTSRIELNAMNVKQLKQYCRELRLSGYSALRKDGLIRLIEISGGVE